MPHSRYLPVTHSPFSKLHMDTLEISPPSHQGFRYVLVIVDDFSRFNHIFLMTKKVRKNIVLCHFVNEVKNKLGITPGYIHTDHGEQGSTHYPQTNGVAEHFNQTLLVKIQCLLAQSNITISYWDKAALHASLLLNCLPHQYLQTMFFSNVMQLLNQPLNLVK
ncbi:hypothetical protein O181_065596 [Austropuccinia psidii MF-1]|uniref:Integrase catalytic domain-containing protein n=1 Tax=Austropuccinia psidii MF-1 TaxID=1389203 RepID=A0A9Q3I1C7_9BASI|nr:hypothetical protein [Austropuccinia psidii MF-1]